MNDVVEVPEVVEKQPTNIREAFKMTPWYPRLGRRRDSFEHMVSYVYDNLHTGRCAIVECGTARKLDNWEGDGQSTLIWDWFANLVPEVKVISLDNNPEAVGVASAQTQHVLYRTGESIELLRSLCLWPSPIKWEQVALLYLDSVDWDMQHKYLSAFHALCELMSCYMPLPSGCMIAVDDVLSAEFGKHAGIAEFMFDQRVPINFLSYQVGWIKP